LARGRQHDGIGQKPHALGKFRLFGHDAQFDLPLQPLLPHRVPTLVVFADMPVAPVARQMIGIVRRLVGNVGEERFAIARLAPR
jgi:hypothetical protein